MSLRDSLEWDIIAAFRGYLICTLPVTNDEFGELDRDGIVLENARDSFEFELTRVFVRPRTSFDADLDRLGVLQAALSKFMVLLGTLTNVEDVKFPTGARRFGHLFQPLTNGEETVDSHYHRLWSLLEHLEASRVELNLIKGHLGAAFKLPSDGTLLDDLKTVQELNHILDTFPSSEPIAQMPPPPAAVDHHDARVHDYAATTFRTVFEHLRTCGTAHKLMLDLLFSKNNSRNDFYLDFFISVCPEHCEWQDTGCSMHKKMTISPQVVTKINLCQEIEWTQSEELSLKIHVNGNEIQNLSQANGRHRHDGDSPSISFREMLSNGAFEEFKVPNGDDLPVPVRFNRDQKETLAVHIAIALSQLLGSQWVGKGWTTKDVYFLIEKKAESELPYRPFVSVTTNGPESQDWTKWSAKLVKTPHLILFGKLLLEIELGTDLDEYIDNNLKKSPTKNLSTLLLGLFDSAKYDLLYRDAVQACLNFHKERKLKREAGDIDVPEMGWCEWDRKYIQNNIITKLAPTSPPRTKLEQKEPVSYQEHHVRHDLPIAYRAASKEPPSSLRSSTPMTNYQESVRLPISAVSFMSPDQGQDTKATMITQKESRLNEKVQVTDSPVSHLTIRTQRATAKNSAKMRVWLNNVEHAQDVVHGESTSSTSDIGDDQIVLFDDMEYSRPSEQANLAVTFWKELRKFNDQLLPRRRLAGTTSNIKIALIDTGVDKSDPLVKGELTRITGRSWVDENPDSYHDICGHGTHLVRLVLQASPTAHMLMAKVSNNKTFSPRNLHNITEAIRWAIQENAHIISLSLGFKSEIPAIKAALEEAINPDSISGRIVIAAAGNWGYNYPRAFPASQKGVLCVHAVNGIGVDGQFNVKVDANNRIATLGVDIGSEWQGKEVWVSGTSFATPIVAAIAANILEFAQRKLDLNPHLWGQLSSYQGMRTALRLMCTDTEKFAYLAPWCLKKTPDEIAEMIKNGLTATPLSHTYFPFQDVGLPGFSSFLLEVSKFFRQGRRMSRSKPSPSFFIVPDEKTNYESSVKLGNVIYRVSQPDLVLLDPGTLAPPLSLGGGAAVLPPPKTLKNYNIEDSKTNSSKYGLFFKILDFFGLGANVSLASGADISKRYEIKSMTINMFVPPPAFLDGLRAQKRIIDVLQSGNDRCAFLITGIVVASGIVFRSLDDNSRENDASLGAHVSGISVGPMGKRSRKRTLKIDWEDDGPTVLAFKVQKLQLTDGELTATEETDGAYFGSDDQAEQVEIDFDAIVDEYDVHGTEPELIHDEFTGQDYTLYLPNE